MSAKTQLAGYAVGREIGRGGCAIVYEAEGPSGVCALKVLSEHRFPATPEIRERFKREAIALQQVQHSNVVRAAPVFKENECLAIEMELAASSLHARLALPSPISLDQALLWLLQISAGLAAIHAAGIVHRDISAKNILLRADGVAVVADLGTAYLPADETITQPNAHLGSLVYISPEQRRDAHSAKAESDVFSLGQLGFQLLTGMHPHGATQPTGYYAPAAPKSLAELVDRMRAYQPTARPANGQTAWEALRDELRTIRRNALPPAPKPPGRTISAPHLEKRQRAAAEQLPLELKTAAQQLLETGPILLPTQAESALNEGWLRRHSLTLHGDTTWTEEWLHNGLTERTCALAGPPAMAPLTKAAATWRKARGMGPQFPHFTVEGAQAPIHHCMTCGAPLRRAGHDRWPGGLKIGYCPACSIRVGRCLMCGVEPEILAGSDEWGDYGLIGCPRCGKTEDGTMATGIPNAEGSEGELSFPQIERSLARNKDL